MAFGDFATLLTTFTGPDENPLSEGGNWQFCAGEPLHLQRKSNQCTSTLAPGVDADDSHVMWVANTFGPDYEAYYTVSNVGTNVGLGNIPAFDLFLRFPPPSVGFMDGYWLQITNANTWGIFVSLTGGTHLIGSGVQALSNGDKIGMRVVCWVVDVWYQPFGSAVWTRIAICTDTFQTTSVTGTGSVGLSCENNTQGITNFFAGTVPRVTPCNPATPIIARYNYPSGV